MEQKGKPETFETWEGLNQPLLEVRLHRKQENECGKIEEQIPPKMASQEGNGELGPTGAKNWIKPTTWMSLEADHPQGLQKGPQPSLHLDFSLVTDTVDPTEQHYTKTSNLQNCGINKWDILSC